MLVSLAFDNDEFDENMCVKNAKEPPFYTAYVKEVQRTIENNAYLEFEAIWREHKATGKPRSIISDELSLAIVKLNEELQHTSLWDNKQLRDSILMEALPPILLKTLGVSVPGVTHS